MSERRGRGYGKSRGDFSGRSGPRGQYSVGRGFASGEFPSIGTVPTAAPNRRQLVSSQVEDPHPTGASVVEHSDPLVVSSQITPEPTVGQNLPGPQGARKHKKKNKKATGAKLISSEEPNASATSVAKSSADAKLISLEEPNASASSVAKSSADSELTSVPDTVSSDAPVSEKLPSPSVASNQQAHQRKKKRQKAIESSLEAKFSEINLDKTIQIPRRPDKGCTTGRPVRLLVNCFETSIMPRKVIMYQLEPLEVCVSDKDGKKRRITATAREKRNLLKQIIPTFPPGSIYDGGFTLCCDQYIPGVSTTRQEREAQINDPNEDRKLFLKYCIFEVKVVEMEDLLRYMNDSSASVLKIPQHAIRVLNCILKLAFKGQFEVLGRNSLFSKTPTRIVESKMMDIHRGFIVSARPQWKQRINIDITFTAFLSAGNLADVLYNKHGDRLYGMTKELMRDIDRIRVETSPLYKEKTGHHRKYTLHGVSQQPANKLKIDNLNQTVAEYFLDKYKIKLKYPDLPCAKVNLKRDVFIPMELLDILPYQSPNSSKADVASEINRLSAVRPKERFQEIRNVLASALQSSPPLLKQFGVQIKDTPVSTEGRVLDVPHANFGGPPVQLRRGNWEVPSFHTPANNNQVIPAILFSVPPNPQSFRSRNTILNGLGREAEKFRLNLKITDGGDLHPLKLYDALHHAMKQGYRLAILVLHDDANYPEIKRLSDLELGIRTQCVRDRTLAKPRVLPNLLLKINCKLLGTNWTIPDLVKSSAGGERFIVLGADVTHPSPTQRDAVRKSVAAVTASYSLDLMRYAVVVRQQETSRSGERSTREIIDNMESIVADLLTCYGRAQNGQLPTKLMFYRDGVSEGQFEIVVAEELYAIQRACGKLRQDYQPAITYIVVQKRHRLRFMPEVVDPRNKTGNVEPGTVIDRDVVHHRDFDFYLSSAEGIQGTCKPAYYHVLYDDSEWSSNALQAFTYFLCHAYQRCSRSVSYPAPTYYAHLAAARAREWLTGSGPLERILDLSRNQFRVHESQVMGMFYI